MNVKKEIKRMKSLSDEDIREEIHELNKRISELEDLLYSENIEENLTETQKASVKIFLPKFKEEKNSLTEAQIDILTNKRYCLGKERALKKDFIDRRKAQLWQKRMDALWSKA